MTRSEERLTVNTEQRPTERVRLHKYAETDYVQVTVPIRREKVRLERQPAGERPDDASAADSDRSPTADAVAAHASEPTDQYEVILHEERPVISAQTVPVERVRLTKRTVTDTETVEDQVRREHIALDTPDQETPHTD